MKKSTLLSLATAGAIVATSAFTFAAWDQMDDTATATVTIRNPVTVTAPATVTFAATDNYGDTTKNPEYSATAEFALLNVPATGYKFKATTTVKNAGSEVPAADLTVTTSVDNEAVTADGKKQVTVKIVPTDTDAAKTLANKSLNVEIKGELVADSAS